MVEYGIGLPRPTPLIPRRERQNTVRGYICSAQAAGNRSWKSCKKYQGCLAHRSPSVKRELIASRSNVQCVPDQVGTR